MTLKARLHEIIFEAETRTGRVFDVALLWAIILSVITVILESVDSLVVQYGTLFRTIEWVFTVLFTIEYVLRLYCVKNPLGYARSFFGIVDLLSIIPTYLSLYFAGAQTLLIIRALRLLRVFRVFKLGRHVGEAKILMVGLRNSREKITVFLGAVAATVLILGSVMYLIEGEASGFDSIPKAIYWAVVTMTTVGYGDIVPQTAFGQTIASVIMILGYGIIAVPTGIVSVELANATRLHNNTLCCPSCALEGHDVNAKFCRECGSSLDHE